MADRREPGSPFGPDGRRVRNSRAHVLCEEAAEAVVLGCTELPLAFAGAEPAVPTVDVMQVHVDALVRQIVGA